MMDLHEAQLRRALTMRLEAGTTLWPLSSAWAALAGLVVAGGVRPDVRTLVVAILLVLLVEPLLGALWDLGTASPSADEPAPTEAISNDPVPQENSGSSILPYVRYGSAGYRLASALGTLADEWRQRRWPALAFAIILAFSLAVSTVLGQAVFAVLVALVVIAIRRYWRSGMVSLVSTAVYNISIPWLIGMVALGSVAETGLTSHAPGLILAALYTATYVGCVALRQDMRLPGLLLMDGMQAAVLAFLLLRQETLAAWVVGLCLIGQAAFHPRLLAGGKTDDYLHRVGLYIMVGMLVSSVALAYGGM